MNKWKRIAAIVLSICSVGMTAMGTGCKNKETEPEKKCEHIWDVEIVKDPTCTEKGEKKKTCTECGAKETEIERARHSLITLMKIPATCTVAGTVYKACQNCEYTTEESIAPLGHKYVNNVCVNNGCGHIYEGGNGGLGGGLGGLGGGVAGGEQDVAKSNLSVATFDGGVGTEWLVDAIARFEAMYANTSFEPGKMGVKINLDGDKNKYAGNKLAESAMLNKDVYFTEAVDYYTMVQQDMVANISDVVTGSMAAYGESGTIEDKLDSTTKAFMTAKDGNYYMIPFYDGFYGFTYDIELFEEEGFYFDDEGDFIRIDYYASVTAFEAAKSNGPDGIDGTYDDGLPATYEQMIALCDQIVAKGYVPFCYSGNYTGYVDRSFFSYAADYEGYGAFNVNNTFNGTVQVVKTITEIPGQIEANITMETVAITEDNGYMLQKQAGKYYALKMQEALFGTTKYIGGTWNAMDYTIAQSEFVKSKYATTRYAMLAEGVWWENEATPAFEELETLKGESKMDRRFGFMPVPKVNAAAAGDQTMLSANHSFGFINKNCENMELAKEFMRFLHTDAEMSKFTAKTSVPRSLNYTVSEEDRATATTYGKSIIDMRQNANVVYAYSSTNLVINNSANFEMSIWLGVALIDGRTRNSAFTSFKDGNATAMSFFNGLYNYQQSKWSSLIR